MGKLPCRNILAIAAFAVVLAILIVRSTVPQVTTDAFGPSSDWDRELPAPPITTFLFEAFAVPGLFTTLPLTIPAFIFGQDWLGILSMALGVGFFWYFVGWNIDNSRKLVPDRIPSWVSAYSRVLVWMSFVVFALGVMVGLRIGQHHWGGHPPYWSEVLTYGIIMAWASLGAFYSRVTKPQNILRLRS